MIIEYCQYQVILVRDYLQAESRCMEKLHMANNYYSLLLEEFGNAVGNEEAQNIHAMVMLCLLAMTLAYVNHVFLARRSLSE